MEKQEQFHIQETDIIAIQNGQWHKIKRIKNLLHGLLQSIVQILMKDLLQLMEKQEQFHTQEKDIIATQNGQWLKAQNKINQFGQPQNTAQTLMKDLLLLMEEQELFLILEKDLTAILNGHQLKEVHTYKKHQNNLNYVHSHCKEHMKITILMIKKHSQNHSHFLDTIAMYYQIHHMLR